jgi:hypothetical protein
MSNKKIPVNGKRKGNRYERQIAKDLSVWFFNDKKILYKHEDSGARKVVYTGDIIPKDVSNYPWPLWPFAVEVKNGYKEHIPTLMNQTRLRKWLVKLLNERTATQRIPIFIAQFHYQPAILLTNIQLNALSTISLAQEYNGDWEIFYVYMFKELLEQNFMEVMPDWFQDVINSENKIVQQIEEETPSGKLTRRELKKKKDKEFDEILGEVII